MKVIIYGGHGTEPKTFNNIDTWELVAEIIFKNTDFEDDVFAILDENNKILYRDFFDTWREEQFLNFNGVKIEI